VRTTDSRHDFPIAPNLLERNFIAASPNRIWLADITYVETDQGWLYLATVMDLYSRKIVGWAMADHLRAELPLAALAMAITTQRPGAGLIHHSDRGVQYASAEYRKMMQSAGFRASMSRKADCYDVSVAPRPFRLFVRNLVSTVKRVIFCKGAHNGRPFGRHKTTVLTYRSVYWRGSKALAGRFEGPDCRGKPRAGRDCHRRRPPPWLPAPAGA
jgi:transposase InsO family protein